MPAAKTVLIIDDEPDILRVLREILSPSFTVVAAGSAREALDRLAFRTPDVILTDIYMPEVDGYELMRAAKRAAPGVPVIAISGGSRSDGGIDPLDLAAKLG